MLISKGPGKKVSQWFRGVGWVEPEFVRKLIDRIDGRVHASFMATRRTEKRFWETATLHMVAIANHSKHKSPHRDCVWLCHPIEHTHTKHNPMPGCQDCADKLGVNIEQLIEELAEA